jgi:hypothetical protein
LHLANEVLAVARKEFPGSIPFARAEVAKKDLGLKVVLCEWNTALSQEVRLGINQAIVHSSRDADSLEKLERVRVGLVSIPLLFPRCNPRVWSLTMLSLRSTMRGRYGT